MIGLLLAAVFSSLLAGPVAATDAGAGCAAFLRADYAQARSILRALAAVCDAQAQYWLGVMYAHGRGYAADCGEAIRWYEKAARRARTLPPAR